MCDDGYELGLNCGFWEPHRTTAELLAEAAALFATRGLSLTAAELATIARGIDDGRDDYRRYCEDADAMAEAWDQRRRAEVGG